MRIVTRQRLRDYAREHPAARTSLLRWERMVSAARWDTPGDVKQTFGDVDPVIARGGNTVDVFNIQGHAHRLVAAIHCNRAVVYVLRLMSHAEYDRRRWIREL